MLQQASFLPCTVENDKRQLQAQSQSRSNIQIGNIIAWCLFGCSSIVDGYYAHPAIPNISVFYIIEWSFWCSNEFNGGQCEMKLRRLQQASFLPCTVENDKRQLQAQSQSRSTSKSGISSGAFLVVLQLTMDIMLSPTNDLGRVRKK